METVEQAAAIALLQRAYDAFNRGDIADAVKELDPDIRWTGPDSFPGGGAGNAWPTSTPSTAARQSK
jgi:ketosteroid isomerase-like protein